MTTTTTETVATVETVQQPNSAPKKPLSSREQSNLRKLVQIDKAAAQAKVEQDAAAWKREQIALLDEKFAALHEAKSGDEVSDLGISLNTTVGNIRSEYFAAVKAAEEKRDAKIAAARDKYIKAVEKMGLAVEVTEHYRNDPTFTVTVPGYDEAKAKIDAQATEVVAESKRRLTMALADSERTILLAGLTGSVAAEQVLTQISGVADGALKALVSGKVDKVEAREITEGSQVYADGAQAYNQSSNRYVTLESQILTVNKIVERRDGVTILVVTDGKGKEYQINKSHVVGV